MLYFLVTKVNGWRRQQDRFHGPEGRDSHLPILNLRLRRRSQL
jgi:hypothetical protein